MRINPKAPSALMWLGYVLAITSALGMVVVESFLLPSIFPLTTLTLAGAGMILVGMFGMWAFKITETVGMLEITVQRVWSLASGDRYYEVTESGGKVLCRAYTVREVAISLRGKLSDKKQVRQKYRIRFPGTNLEISGETGEDGGELRTPLSPEEQDAFGEHWATL